MRQYELVIRIAQVHHLIDEHKYNKALTVIRTIDIRQVKGLSDLSAFAEVFTKTEQFDAAKATYLRIYRKSRTRRVLYRLIYLAIRTNSLDEAEEYYQEFVRMNPNARDALILRYRIDKAAGAPIGQLIEILEALKEEEYIEEWAYELAKLYYKAGRYQECHEECSDIVLWFGHGEIVDRAKKLNEYLEKDTKVVFWDDTDFTDKEKAEINPDDTGSLPDLDEYLQAKSLAERRREEEERNNSAAEKAEDNYEPEKEDIEPEEKSVDIKKYDMPDNTPEKDMSEFAGADLSKDDKNISDGLAAEKKKEDFASEAAGQMEEKVSNEAYDTKNDIKSDDVKEDDDDSDDFIDDYEDDFGDMEETDFTKFAMEGLQKLSGLLKLGGRKGKSEKMTKEKAEEIIKEKFEKPLEESLKKPVRPERNIKEKNIKEKSAKVAKERVDRSIKEGPEKPAKEKPVRSFRERPERPVKEKADRLTKERVEHPVKEKKEAAPVKIKPIVNFSQSGTGITQDLSKEIAAIVEAEHREQLKEKAVTIIKEHVNSKQNELVPDVEKNADEKSVDIPTDVEEIGKQIKAASDEEIFKYGEMNDENSDEIKEAAAVKENKHEYTAKKQEPIAEEKIPEEAVEEQPEAEEVPTEILRETTGELLPDDLPTTRALHCSLEDILALIEGEPDPSHFVLIGNGEEKIVGITKRIVRVMSKCGYASMGRIAKINARQLNTMRIDDFKDQLKGNCILVDEAAELLFPTINKLFDLMDEFYGDFIVILADEGDTLDQLFRFTPSLGRRFKYIIDIHKFNEDDYKD